MSEFDLPLPGFRLADTLHGDTLQKIATRELGDATRWVDLANINSLLPPYLTDDPEKAGERVLLTGGVIVVPALSPASQSSRGTSEADLYLEDLALVDGHLEADDDGDLLGFSGRDNLRQALMHRVIVERGDLMFHQEYGSLVRTLIGAVTGPTASTLAAQYVRSTLRADPRVREVLGVTASVAGDVITVVADVLPITGQSTKIEAVI